MDEYIKKHYKYSPDYLHLATTEQVAKLQQLKPLHRGDLVLYQGNICVIVNNELDEYNRYYIARMDIGKDVNMYFQTI